MPSLASCASRTYLKGVSYPAKSADLIAAAPGNGAPQRFIELLGLLPTATSFDRFAEVAEHLRQLKLSAGLTLKIRPEHYPFWSVGRLGTVKRANVIARVEKDVMITPELLETEPKDTLVEDASLSGLRRGELKNLKPTSPTGDITLCFDDNSMEDFWLALAWGQDD
jgi:hypothetical protein